MVFLFTYIYITSWLSLNFEFSIFKMLKPLVSCIVLSFSYVKIYLLNIDSYNLDSPRLMTASRTPSQYSRSAKEYEDRERISALTNFESAIRSQALYTWTKAPSRI